MGLHAGHRVSPAKLIARSQIKRCGVGRVKPVDLFLRGAQGRAPFWAGRADIIGRADDFNLGVGAIYCPQLPHDDRGHIGTKRVGIAFALESDRAQNVVGAQADRCGHPKEYTSIW